MGVGNVSSTTGITTRAGRYVWQPAGYRAFIPAPLPPDPPVNVDAATIALLSRADQSLGRLDGVAQTLPNPDLFIAMYVRREAVESSQIEGTQSTLEDVLAFELDPRALEIPRDVKEVSSLKGFPRQPTAQADQPEFDAGQHTAD